MYITHSQEVEILDTQKYKIMERIIYENEIVKLVKAEDGTVTAIRK
jgi:hypothetical protein